MEYGGNMLRIMTSMGEIPGYLNGECQRQRYALQILPNAAQSICSVPFTLHHIPFRR